MTVRQWLEDHTYGLSLMFEQARDRETMGKAVDAFLEVARLSGEVSKLGGSCQSRREPASK